MEMYFCPNRLNRQGWFCQSGQCLGARAGVNQWQGTVNQ